MKKLLIASDLHGSALYCRQLLAHIEADCPDRILLLGDLLYHGPRNDLPPGYAPKEVIPLLNALRDRLLCVRGNCDTEVDQMVLDFPILSDYALLTLGETTVYATHGHRFSPAAPPPLCAGDVMLFGHTHVPVCLDCGHFTALNPGSLSIPKENSPHSYMLWENGRFTWHRLEDGSVWKEYAPL